MPKWSKMQDIEVSWEFLNDKIGVEKEEQQQKR